MTTKLVVAPVAEPVTLTQMKSWLRETGTDQDDNITLLIQAAREYGENYTRRAWAQQTLLYTQEYFCGGDIELPRPNLQAVSSVKYIDSNGVLQTLAASVYQADTTREPGCVRLAYGQTWPDVRASDFNAVQITYVAGYATGGSPFDPTAIPAAARNWLMRKVAQLYEHREEIIVGTVVAPVPRTSVDGMLDALIVDLF